MKPTVLELKSKPTGYRLLSALLVLVFCFCIYDVDAELRDREFYFLLGLIILALVAAVIASIYERVIRIDLDKDEVLLVSACPFLIKHRGFRASHVVKILIRVGSGTSGRLCFAVNDGTGVRYIGYHGYLACREDLIKNQSDIANFIGIDNLHDL
jgi:hypothetical protein